MNSAPFLLSKAEACYKWIESVVVRSCTSEYRQMIVMKEQIVPERNVGHKVLEQKTTVETPFFK